MSSARTGHTRLTAGSTRTRPAALAAAIVLAAGLLGLAGPAAASRATANRASSGPWKIETAAGGVGGPGPARGVYIGGPCAVTFSAGQLYVGSNGLIRSISLRTGRLNHAGRDGRRDRRGPGWHLGPGRRDQLAVRADG